MIDSLLQDLRLAVRALRKSPAFAAAAIITLALGLGVNISVFTVMNAALLESLPVRQPERLVHVYSWSEPGGDRNEFSYPLYVDLRDGSRALSGLAAYTAMSVGVSDGQRSERVVADFVSSNYFTVLGVELPLGPGFTGRDELRGAAPVAVISSRLWQSLYGADSGVVGRSLLVNGQPVTITAVAPSGFEGIVRGQRADAWIPLPQFSILRNRPDTLTASRESSWLSLIGRLAPDASGARVAEELTGIGRGLNVINAGPGFTARTKPAGMGDRGLVETLERPLSLLMLVVGLILVVAAANVANLLLARAHARQADIAMRRALGASRTRIVRLILTEGAVVALAGGGLGLLLTYWLVALFEVRTAAGTLLTLPLEPNGTVILFATLLSALAAVVTGLVPALSTSRPDLLVIVKGGADGGRSRRAIRASLVVVQVALSLVLVVGAGLFLRSLGRLHAIDPSLADSRVLAATLNLTLRGYDEPRGRQLYSALLERVRALPGIESATLAYVLPVTAGGMRMDVRGSSTKPAVEGMVGVDLVPVATDFFRTVGVPLVAGRDFSDRDNSGAPKVVIVNESLKQHFWQQGAAVGQSFSIGGDTYEVVGVARDTKYRSLRESARNVMYLPYAQSHEAAANLLVRTSLPAAAATDRIRAAVRELDPALPVYNVRTLAQHVGRSLYLDRVRAELIGYLAALALVLAAVGIYGVVSYTVAERTREVGIRVALGANPGAVLLMMLRSGVKLTLAGIAGGLALSYWLTKRIASDLFGITPTDPITLAAACAVLLAVAVLATLIPARRATRIDPVNALRA